MRVAHIDSTQQKFRTSSHDPYEVKRDVWLGLCEIDPGAARHGSRRRPGLQEDPGHGWPRGPQLRPTTNEAFGSPRGRASYSRPSRR